MTARIKFQRWDKRARRWSPGITIYGSVPACNLAARLSNDQHVLVTRVGRGAPWQGILSDDTRPVLIEWLRS